MSSYPKEYQLDCQLSENFPTGPQELTSTHHWMYPSPASTAGRSSSLWDESQVWSTFWGQLLLFLIKGKWRARHGLSIPLDVPQCKWDAYSCSGHPGSLRQVMCQGRQRTKAERRRASGGSAEPLNEGPRSLRTHRLLVRWEKINPYSSHWNWFSATHSWKHSYLKYRVSENHQVITTATLMSTPICQALS